MRYTPAHMLGEIERNIHFVPAKAREVVEPLIHAMNAGEVTPITDAQRETIHRTFILHCVSNSAP